MRGPKSVEVGLDLKVLSIKGTWEPNDVERVAAWELYVELITRISVVPLQNGFAREALTSLYSIFGEARGILRRHGPAVAEPGPGGDYTLGYLTVAMLNFALRPFLSYWHPELLEWETGRPLGAGIKAHEDAWPRVGEFRADLDRTAGVVASYASLLATACGVPDLQAAVPTRRAVS
jgi:hypothetical protein